MLCNVINKSKKLAIGLMSGTSLDGIDAVLVEIEGHGIATRVRERDFICLPFEEAVRSRILAIAQGNFGGSSEISDMSFLLGQLFADAVLALCQKSGVNPNEIDLVGSHGQTVWHSPVYREYLGHSVTSTLQIGEPSFINEVTSAVVVSNFRVRDIAAGGMGAPLVAYTEYLLYRSETETVALQNIGGIGNVTILPAGCTLDDVVAFDTGPGNMVIDALVYHTTEGGLTYDRDGAIAASGTIHDGLLQLLLNDSYYSDPLPKTTGREKYNDEFIQNVLEYCRLNHVSTADMIATATIFTAKTIALALTGTLDSQQILKPARLIVGGGGALNPTLISFMRKSLPKIIVVTNEEIGYNSSSKEAVAFAVLANEAICSSPNNAIGATGAKRYVIMGQISQ